MIDFIQWIGTVGGIGGVFAVIMFFVYRASEKRSREDRKFMEDRLTGVLEAYDKSTQDNTKVLSELYTWLKAKNGS